MAAMEISVNKSKWAENEPRAVGIFRAGKFPECILLAVSTTEAREIAAALIAAADSFEALKPDPQVEFVKKLESLGLGAVVETLLQRYLKQEDGLWFGTLIRNHGFASGSFSHKTTTILSEGVK